MSNPDIILLVIDSLRAEHVGMKVSGKSLTPNIDKIAEKAIVFDNAFASAPWTLPSHASLFTGLHPFQHRVNETNLYLSDSLQTLPMILSEIGYECIGFAPQNGWLTNETNMIRGFSEFYDSERFKSIKPPFKTLKRKISKFIGFDILNTSRKTINLISDIIEKKNSAKPLFVYANLMDVHMPYLPDKIHLRKQGINAYDKNRVKYLIKSFKEYRSKPESLSNQDLEILTKLYKACVASVDKRLAPLINKIINGSAKSDCLLIITSDHGESLNEHGILGHWFALYDVLLKVPLIIFKNTGFQLPDRIKNPVQQKDIYHTVLDLIDKNYNSFYFNKAESLIDRIKNDKFPEFIYAEHSYTKMNLEHIRKYNPHFKNDKFCAPKKCIRDSQYKYIQSNYGSEFYNIKQDPKEQNNLYEEQSQLVNEYQNKLEEFVKSQKEFKASHKKVKFTDNIKKQLEDLGYL